MSKIIIYISALILFLISLDIQFPNLLNIPAASLLWNGWNGALMFGVTIWYIHNFFTAKIKYHPAAITISTLLTVSLLIPLFTHSFQQQNNLDYLRLLIIIWTIPLIYSVLQKYSSKLILITLLFLLCFQSVWGITQFSLQRDLNLNLIGESLLRNSLAGVAKFQLPTTSYNLTPIKFIRAYGPYPHANSYGGALALGFILLILLNKKYRLSSVYLPLAFILFLGIIVSFSRSAWISLFISLTLLTILNIRRTVPHKVKPLLLTFLITMIVFLPLIYARLSDPLDTAIPDRISYVSVAINIIKQSPKLTGVGIGNYTKSLTDYLSQQQIAFQPWHITPVHSTPLLLIAEWGIAPTVIITLLMLFLLFTAYRQTWPYLIPVLPLLLFDHYLLTQSAPLLLLLCLLVVLAHPSLRSQSPH